MGRPKLSDTGSGPRTLSVRWSEEHHIMYLQLGGSKWLRSVVAAEIEKKAAVTTLFIEQLVRRVGWP